MRAPCDEWELAGPRFTRVVGGWNAPTPGSALGTSSHFAVVESSPTGAVEIEVAGPPEAELQVTVVPLGADLPRLDLTVSKLRGPAGELRLRARVKERNGVPVRLSALSWEPLTPSANPRSAGFRCGRLDMLGIAAAFGSSALPGWRASSRSRPIPMPGVSPGNGPLAIKVIGTDEKGRRIAAWAELDAEPAHARRRTLNGQLDSPTHRAVDLPRLPNRFASLCRTHCSELDRRDGLADTSLEQSRMNDRRIPKLAVALFVAALVIALPALADEIRGKIKSIDRARSEIVVADEKTERDVTVSLGTLNKGLGKSDRSQETSRKGSASPSTTHSWRPRSRSTARRSPTKGPE